MCIVPSFFQRIFKAQRPLGLTSTRDVANIAKSFTYTYYSIHCSLHPQEGSVIIISSFTVRWLGCWSAIMTAIIELAEAAYIPNRLTPEPNLSN